MISFACYKIWQQGNRSLAIKFQQIVYYMAIYLCDKKNILSLKMFKMLTNHTSVSLKTLDQDLWGYAPAKHFILTFSIF